MIKDWWNGIKRWFSYYSVVKDAYEWDYSSVLYLEKEQLKRIRDCISKYRSHVGWEIDVWRINICINLLDIILVNTKVIELIEDNSYIDKEGYYHPANKWKCLPYVNINNCHRFFKHNQFKSLSDDLFKAELYEEKAWQLYHKMRMQYLKTFWD